MAGSERLIARWREIGAWWADEPTLEVARYLDKRGIRREVQRVLSPDSESSEDSGNSLRGPGKQDRRWDNVREPDHRDEWSLRPRKVRDEKVSYACGKVVKGRGEEYAAFLRGIGHSGHPKAYVPLHVMSGYAFGRSVLFAEQIARTAAHYGLPAAAIADPFSLVGAVEFAHEAAKLGVKPLIGASLEIEDGGEIVLIARSKLGYRSLSMLITACLLEEPRQYPLATWKRLERYAQDLLCLTGGDLGPLNRRLITRDFEQAEAIGRRLVAFYGSDNVFIEIERSYLPWEIGVNGRLLELAEHLGLRSIAGGVVTHARPEEFPAQDILTCAETLCTVDEVIGRKPQRHPGQPQIKPTPRRALNAERFFHNPDEMAALFDDRPDLLATTLAVAERCDDNVLPDRTRLPQIFDNPNQVLRDATWAGASLRYRSMPAELKQRIHNELDRIDRLNFADHFLVMWDACRWAGEQNILFSGRGSVVDSVVSYCLGFSRIDAFRHNLLFDRFLPEDGSKRPDIDVDFEAKRRDDVRNYLSGKYGERHVATVCAVGALCTRGIVRDVGKALGLPSSVIGFLAKRVHGGVPPEYLEKALMTRPELRGSHIPRERFRWVFQLAKELADVPRNMRAHSSGVIISSAPIEETVPVMWSASDGLGDNHLRIIQWDKRSTKHFFDKFDILCLRGQDVLAGTQNRVRDTIPDFNVEHAPLEDEEAYRAMRSGNLIGIPQSASPAMRQAHIRLRTQDLVDASLVQAGIRPGVGGAVKINELIARRRGKPYTFEHPNLEVILGHTYGIVVFQEQVDQLLQTFCGYSSGDAEDIRDKIHKRRREDYGQVIRDEVLSRIQSRGYSATVAEHVFELVAGFKGYGFAQGHALAFAEISIRSIFCQQNFPAEYFAALLQAQPAGYYGPTTIANEARSRGVAMLPVDVNLSNEDFQVEDVQSEMDPKIVLPRAGIRTSLTQVAGLSEATRKRIVAWQIASAPAKEHLASLAELKEAPIQAEARR